MSQRIETGTADVPGVGRVRYQVQETRNASGEVAARVLQAARYVATVSPVTDEEHLRLIGRYLRAIV